MLLRPGSAAAAVRRPPPPPPPFAAAARAAGVAFLSALILMEPARAAAAAQPTGSLEVLRGPARVVDGDTLVISGTKIRLFGVDAPEKAQTCRAVDGAEYACGAASAAALSDLMDGREVSCAVRQLDLYGRSVAACSVEDADVGRWLVRGGHAVAYRAYSRAYVADEDAARAARLGIWSGDFVVPQAWRKQQKASGGGGGFGSGPLASGAPSARRGGAAELVAAMDDGQQCSRGGGPVKGNINARGDRIYHVPGGASYASVAIDAERGERYFCSAAEAEAAGWRPAGRRGGGGGG
jgi:endonuclease YncB( thermonuclease family)